MISFVHPEVFLLALPALYFLRRAFRCRRLVAALRLSALLLALAALAEPYRRGIEAGRDLVLVLDRSRSVADRHAATIQDWAERAAGERRAGDRIGTVVFGADAAVETSPRADYSFAPPVRVVDRDATDLARALDAGLSLIPPGRQGSLLVLSDGESTGRDAMPAAREALRRGVRIDVVPLPRDGAFDVAVEELALPEEIAAGEPFQFAAWVRADRAVDVRYRLLRDGREIAAGTRALRAGLDRFSFRDVAADEGVHVYQLEVAAEGDLRPENDRARAVLRSGTSRRVLVVAPGGRSDRLVRALANAGIAVEVAAPESAPLSLERLGGFRAVVLENVRATDLPSGGMAALAAFVRDLGGGLWMTGGRASFGAGGYHRSAVEEVLPVSMEVRQEQRKFALAMAIALDRSGSMAVAVPGGGTKMDLADAGAAAAVELLSPIDAVAVIAVDSEAHVVVEAGAVTDPEAICNQIRRIESQGGGIYIGAALHACAEQLAEVPQRNRHIVLFADANDAEQPEDYRTFVPKLVAAGVTVSVIGLGSSGDTDAALLEEIATLGNGRCFFVEDPADLPRVFAEETIQVAKSAVVEGEVAVAMQPAVLAMADLAALAFPVAGGYSVAYAKPRAQVGAVTEDEQQAPFLAFWQHGLGRTAAFLGELDGDLSGGFASWGEFGTFVTTAVRWLMGTDAAGEVFAALERSGHEGVLSVEVEEGAEARLAALTARVLRPDGSAEEVLLERVSERRLEARFPMQKEGVYQAALASGDPGAKGGVLRVAPVTLPYSPEFEPARDREAGAKLLARIAETAGGSVAPQSNRLFVGSRESAGVEWLARAAAWICALVLVLEIAVRRLQLELPRAPAALWWAKWPRFARKPASAARADAPPPAAAPATGSGEEPGPPKEASASMADLLNQLKKRGR